MYDLLFRRMLELQLDKDEIARVEPVTFRELQRLCASCESREQCELGLADDFADFEDDEIDAFEVEGAIVAPN